MAIIVLAISQSGMDVARRLVGALDAPIHGRKDRVDGADVVFENALDHTRDLFAAGHTVIGICAAGILIRAVAPILSDKTQEPPLIAVPDDGAHVVPLLGGHRGANRLARQVADILEVSASVTTAGDVALGVSLDEPPLGYRLATPENAKSVMAGLLGGGGAKLEGEVLFDLPHDPKGAHRIVVSENPEQVGTGDLLYHSQRYTLGLGCARNCDPVEMEGLVHQALSKAGIVMGAIAAIGSLDLKADEPAMNAISKKFGVPYRLFSADELEEMTPKLQNPSKVVFNEVGCHGVSEAAALALGGEELVVPKMKSANATCAIARAERPITDPNGRTRGRLSIIGIGPGQATWRTPEASRLIADAEELVGYGLYIDLLGPLAAGKIRSDFPLGGEEDRCRYALEEAAKGKNVALICSGDAGIYAMGALVFELMDRDADALGVSDAAKRVDVICTPGISALQGAAVRAGAPLGHDFCAISLSDLLTPRGDIIKRLNAAAEGDFVIAFYNPVSKRRRTLLAEARDILLQHRPADTPVLLASSLGRSEEEIRYRRLVDLQVDEVDMLTVVLIGSSHSKLAQLGEGPRMYTPRGYARKIDGDLS
ncbi:MAG: precorrin-3B C(17)-methyltransferase [Pseudomonadota bacterium]